MIKDKFGVCLVEIVEVDVLWFVVGLMLGVFDVVFFDLLFDDLVVFECVIVLLVLFVVVGGVLYVEMGVEFDLAVYDVFVGW